MLNNKKGRFKIVLFLLFTIPEFYHFCINEFGDFGIADVCVMHVVHRKAQ